MASRWEKGNDGAIDSREAWLGSPEKQDRLKGSLGNLEYIMKTFCYSLKLLLYFSFTFPNNPVRWADEETKTQSSSLTCISLSIID